MQTQLVAALSLLWLSSVAQCFIISVKDTTGREHKLDVDPTKTVGSLKQKIHEFESSIMPTTMELIFGGHRLEDDRMLAGCGLVHGSTILVMRKKEEKLEFYGVDARDIDKIEQKIDELAWKDLGSLDGVAMKKVKEAEKIRDSLWLGYEKFMEEKTGKRRP